MALRPTAGPSNLPTLWSLAPSSFLPALVYEIGNGAIAPVIALVALRLGATSSNAGFMLALLGIGQVLGDVPAASIADRIGDRRAMMVAAGTAVVALFGCAIAPSLLMFGAALLVVGSSNSTFYLARQSYLTVVVVPELRARAMSTLGGSHRIGLFIGPFVGAAVIGRFGLHAAFVAAMISASTVIVLLAVIPDVVLPEGHPIGIRGGVSARTTLIAHRRLLATLGIAVLAVGAVRAARQTVLPLWAEHIGLSAETTSLIFGVAGVVDMALFYPAGKIMDRHGRLAIALPSMVILAGAMLLLPLTRTAFWLTAVAMTMSLGNGIGAGIMMTVGADAAPADNRTKFLGLWRLLSDSGNAAGPVLVSAVATVWTLAAGILAIGCAGLLSTASLAVWVPRYSAFATRRSVRARAKAL